MLARIVLIIFACVLFGPTCANALPASVPEYWCAGFSDGTHSASDTKQAEICRDAGQTIPNIYDNVTCDGNFQTAGRNEGAESCIVDLHFFFPNNPEPQYRLGGQIFVGACVNGAKWQRDVGCVRFGDRDYNKPADDFCIPCFLKNQGLGQNPAVGDPIYPLTGSRREEVDLGLTVGGQPIKLSYDTVAKVPEANANATWVVPSLPAFGPMWHSNMHRSVVLQTPLGSAYGTAAMDRGGANWETAAVPGLDSCSGNGGTGGLTYAPTVNPNLTLQFSGTGAAASIVDGIQMTEEAYDTSGAITTLSQARGGTLTFVYSAGNLTSVSDQFGRQVQFTYEQPVDTRLISRIKTITAPEGTSIQVGYDGLGNLQTLAWADANIQTFVYENQAFPWALTGIVDESTKRYGTFGYDANGRANATSLGSGVDAYSVTYTTAPNWQVSDTYVSASNILCREHRWQAPQGTQVSQPNLQVRSMSASAVNGMVAVGQQLQVAGSGSTSASSATTYDASGNIASYDDFSGNRACFAYDTPRNIPTITLEGLAGGVSGKACPADLSAYAPSAGDAAHPERKTTISWHPDWLLQVREAKPKKITTWVYNGQPDPIAGTTVNCVTPTTTLPDGKPLAVLCARYEQATTDATGGLGLSATVSGATRAWTYTYNQYGQVLTETTPKQSPTDVLSHTTTYAYYPSTSFAGSVGHTMGDLNTITNPLAQVTTFLTYDKAGRLLSSRDANLTVTSMSYWPRGWLHTQTVTPASGTPLTTTYDYWPTGLLKTVTMPDASTLNYAYDDAHRLTDITDAAGNKVHYVLDNVGNRTSEQVTDASGQLASTVSRVYDQLNRVQSTTGAMH